jgi:hypothetical protein
MPARALELLILTAARTSEVLEAPWSEFKEQERLWVIDPDKTEHPVVFTKRHSDVAASTPTRAKVCARGKVANSGLALCPQINNILTAKQPVTNTPRWWRNLFTAKGFDQLDRGPA